MKYGATCKHCNQNIIYRSKAQGWLHTGTNEAHCRSVTRAEPPMPLPFLED